MAGIAAPTHAAPVRFILQPAAGTIFTIEGHAPASASCPKRPAKPLRAKYRGRLEFLRASDGTVSVIEQVPFRDYLDGLAEVPPSWPDAALRAQAIAARSYAIHALHNRPNSARTLGYDICASDRCQVYRGATIALGAFGDRWVAASHGTAGDVLTYQGRVIQAFYFSTSDGRTRRSFPGGTPQPWLPSVSGEDDDAPLAHWTQRIPRARLDAILRAAGVSSVNALSNSELRLTLNSRAPCQFPSEFPGALPQTIPSEQFTKRWVGNVLVFSGRGWGHYVGMSQWGAKSLADRGSSAAAILSHYYGPARVTHITEPGVIRVLAIEGMQRILVSASGRFTATTSSGSALAAGDRFQIGGGSQLSILRGTGPSLTPVLSVTAGVESLEAKPGDTIEIPFTISGAARISLAFRSPLGVTTTTTPESFVKGDGKVSFPLTDSAGNRYSLGDYTLMVVAEDAIDHVQTTPIAVKIAAPPKPAAPPAKGSNWWLYVAASAAVAIGAASFGAQMRRARRRRPI